MYFLTELISDLHSPVYVKKLLMQQWIHRLWWLHYIPYFHIFVTLQNPTNKRSLNWVNTQLYSHGVWGREASPYIEGGMPCHEQGKAEIKARLHVTNYSQLYINISPLQTEMSLFHQLWLILKVAIHSNWFKGCALSHF